MPQLLWIGKLCDIAEIGKAPKTREVLRSSIIETKERNDKGTHM